MERKEEKSVDIRELLAVVLKRKWLVVIPLILATAAGYGTTFLLTPEYRSSTIIWIDRPNNVSRELVSIIGREANPRMSGDDRRRQLQSLQNELTSQAYLYQLIRDLKLDVNPEISRQAARMREGNPGQSLEQLKFHLLLEKLRGQIGVAFVGADQIKITVESVDPVEARNMVRRLTEILEQEKTKYELEKILDNQSFADLQLERTEWEYQQAVDSLTAARVLLTQVQLPENISSQQNLREVRSDVERLDLESTNAASELRSLVSQLESYDLDKSRLEYTDTLVELRAEIDGQVATFAGLMEKYAWDEQTVVSANIRLNDNAGFLQRELAAAVDRQFASFPDNHRDLLARYFFVRENLDILNSRQSQLQLALDQIDTRLSEIPRLEAQITELERKATDARRYRDAFRSEETTVEILSERAKDRTKYKIVEPARVPLAPFWPDRKQILVMAFLLGLVIGGGAVFLAE
ncbi:MAG: Wzz/FepE/Etk N-terminal domain-containing protein, partial [candidate division Zixibacteria bacterium]|nr:Wzz/FepE/Etk N-terminal domain-containing protein [candidate division Zixibacteria bacterium]